MLSLLCAVIFVLCVVIVILPILLSARHKNLEDKFDEYKERVEEVNSQNEDTIKTLATNLTKERSRNKSVEVRTGFILEKIAPFMEVFQEDPTNAHHLGNPIDFIVFNDDSIVFVEVKTGKARLTKKQNSIKKLVEEGKVSFKTVRFDWEDKDV